MGGIEAHECLCFCSVVADLRAFVASLPDSLDAHERAAIGGIVEAVIGLIEAKNAENKAVR